MPINKKWSKFNKKLIDSEKDEFGIYELADKNGIIYIGGGKIKSSLTQHFRDGEYPIVGTSYYRVIYTKGKEVQDRSLKRELKKYFEENDNYPKYNRD